MSVNGPNHIPPRARLSALIAALAVVCVGLITAPAAAPQSVDPPLRSHSLVLGNDGALLAWFRPQEGRGYDRVMRLGWDFIERKVPRDRRWGTGLPIYLVSSVFNGRTGQGSYWQHNPASLYGQFVDSLVTWYAYSGDRTAIRVVRRMLDYQLAHGTTPSNWAWPRVPFATACAGDREYGRCLAWMPRSFYGGIETDKVGELGTGYAQFYELTGERRYLRAAIAGADALARRVRAGDARHTPWPFRVSARTGRVIRGEEYGGLVVAPIRLFDELIRLGVGDRRRYGHARALAWNWLLRNPLNPRSRAWRKWSGYFEDVDKSASNVNQAAPTMTARYLLTHPAPETIDPDWRSHVEDMLEWVRTYFGRGPFHGAWAIDEQHPPGGRGCCSAAGLGSTTSRWGAVNALYAERTGDPIARRRAIGSLNYATYFSDRRGRVACCGDDFGNPYWFDDGYADYSRSFSWAMGALPELAPHGQDHLLRSTSVIQSVRYRTKNVAYRAFHRDGTEVLRLSFEPASVWSDGGSLERRADLDGPGFTVEQLADGDYAVKVRRDAARRVVIAGQ